MPKELLDPVYCAACDEVHSRSTVRRHLRNGGPSRTRIAQQHDHLRRHRVQLQRQRDPGSLDPLPPQQSFEADFAGSQRVVIPVEMEVDSRYHSISLSLTFFNVTLRNYW